VDCLHRWLSRVDPPSGRRIQPRDRKRIVRALEIYLLTGRPMTEHFEQTVPAVPDARVLTLGVRVPRELLRSRVARRVDEQFERGVVDEVLALTGRGVPRSSHAFSGLVYRQVVDYLDGVRNLAATRELVVRENMRYAKRQLTWFRREPGVIWIEGPGETNAATGRAIDLVRSFLETASAASPSDPSSPLG
jgi:tRNA dimethylallyltransferase